MNLNDAIKKSCNIYLEQPDVQFQNFTNTNIITNESISVHKDLTVRNISLNGSLLSSELA